MCQRQTETVKERKRHRQWPHHNATPTMRKPPGPDGSSCSCRAHCWLAMKSHGGGRMWRTHKQMTSLAQWHPGSRNMIHAASFSFSQSSTKSGWCIFVCPYSLLTLSLNWAAVVNEWKNPCFYVCVWIKLTVTWMTLSIRLVCWIKCSSVM